MSTEIVIVAMITGIAFSGMVGTWLEAQTGEPARLGIPFLRVEYPFRSLIRLISAGPYLLVSEVMAVHQQHSAGWGVVLTGFAFAIAWCLALGIICVEALWQLTQLL